ncbi:MAG: hypothetical protein M1834_006664 [Cirrosporium novae-zelandiae]|nr:MAG: hypothetical protein M1834_006664 [Cirrosporium novae-zelandiae]
MNFAVKRAVINCARNSKAPKKFWRAGSGVRWISTERQWSTPLAKTIANAIEHQALKKKIFAHHFLSQATGPISIAAFMRQCLTSPDGGYYTSQTAGRDQFGQKGDFITSPEISQVFGELLGIWFVAEWMAQGRRSSGIELIEVGPGRGTLMDDMLRVGTVCNFKTLASSLEAVYLVEASPALRETQKQLLCGDNLIDQIDIGFKSKSKYFDLPVIWTEHIGLVPPGQDKSPFIFAHEFFDALPINAFQSVAPTQTQDSPSIITTPTGPIKLNTNNNKNTILPAATPQWRELLVFPAPPLTTPSSTEFQLSLAKASNPNSLLLPELSPRYRALKSHPGSTIEICPEGLSHAEQFAQCIGGSTKPGCFTKPKPSGAALILDYGPLTTIPVNSLRGIRHHKRVSPLSAPGQVDLSADVDFTALAEAALNASPGVEVHGPVEQGFFLGSLGIEERARQLLEGVTDEEKKVRLESGWKRLVERGGGGMGRIYKAMAILPEGGGRRRPVGFGGGVV